MKRFLVCVGLAALLAGIAATASAVPSEFGGNEYEVLTFAGGSAPWTAANASVTALGDGWHLATITSADEQAFINSLLPIATSISRTQYWLGGFQTPEGFDNSANWRWVTGEVWSYTNWGQGQPDDWDGDPAGGMQWYLAMDSDQGSWGWDDNTLALQFTRGFIIERVTPAPESGPADDQAAPVPEPSTMLLLGSGLLGLAGYGRKGRKP